MAVGAAALFMHLAPTLGRGIKTAPHVSAGRAAAPRETGRPSEGPRSSTEATGAAPLAAGRFASGDTSYRETGCDTLSDVADLVSSHQPGALRATAEALARRRYPTGLAFLQAQADRELAVWLTGAPESFAGVVSRFDSAVHEGAHFWGFKRFNHRTVSYPIRVDLTLETRRLTNFHRSEVLAHHVDAASDSYANTYLAGQSGAQGFNSLLDEYNAYAHSLAARYCTRDLMPPNNRVSARDGILTMMYYVEVYLSVARTKHQADYAAILADPGHRRLILTVWDRAEFFLRETASLPALGISDDRIEKWVYTPAGLEELALVRRTEQAVKR